MNGTDVTRVRVMNALRRLVSALRSPGADAPAGLPATVAQQFALRVIGARPGLTMTELARATLTTRSAISEVVVRLVRQGMVRREPDSQDHRRIRLQLTPDGAIANAALGETTPERLVRALDTLTPAMRVSLAEALESWTASAGLGQMAPHMFGEPSAGRAAGEPSGRAMG
ncbi:MAG TPA: MarR family transcriptional regulator [Gemmatimonadaceae bacterium]